MRLGSPKSFPWWMPVMNGVVTVSGVAELPGTPPQAQGAFVVLPRPRVGPLRAVIQRLAIATGILGLAILLVWLDRASYRDAADGEVSLIDAAYYATVSLSTTGYGDVTPVTERSRLVTTLFITPLRVLFLIVLVGTTLEVLTQRTREQWRVDRWRSRVRDHTVVVGYGTKGRSAIRALLGNGSTPQQITVIDAKPEAIAEASDAGHVGVLGDATRNKVIRRAEVERAKRIIVAAQRDDAAVLVTLSARKLNPRATIVAAVRESENAELLTQSGADQVITSSEAAGRLLALSTLNPTVAAVIEDLLVPGVGLELVERAVVAREVGGGPRASRDVVLAILRDGVLHHFDDPSCVQLVAGDRVVVVRSTAESVVADPDDADADSGAGSADSD